MSTRGKFMDVILVDVSPAMHSHLPDVGRVLFNFALAKTLNKPSHEMALILFGTEESKNAVHELEGGFEHVSILQELRTPNQETLQLLESLPQGPRPGDVGDAIAVALDLLKRANEIRHLAPIPKRVTLISNFAHAGQPLDDDFLQDLAKIFAEQTAQLQLICMGALDDGGRQTQEQVLKELEPLRVEAGDREVRFVQRPSDLPCAFRLHEVSLQCVKAELEIGAVMKLRLRVYKKVGFEKLPSLKDKAIHDDGYANVIKSVAAFPAAPEGEDGEADATAAEAAEPVPFEEQVKAYRYGKQYVPISEVDDMFYAPGKTLQLLGFVDLKPLQTDQRYLLLGDPSVLLPEQDEAAQVACSGLVQSMLEKNKAAVVRYGRQARSQVSLCALLPQMGSATVPDHFVMIGLPFSEDMRCYSFPPLISKQEQQPSSAQAKAAMALVTAMDLTAAKSPEGVPELLKPEETPNPTLARFYAALGKVSLHPGEDYTGKEEELLGSVDEDKVARSVLQPPWQHFRTATADPQSAFKEAFATQVVERTPKKQRDGAGAAQEEGAAAGTSGAAAADAVSLSDEYPVEDFRRAVTDGKAEAAVAALGRRVNDLVDKSVRNRAYPKAQACCEAMRQALVDKADAAPFNDFLRALKAKYHNHDAHAEFWTQLCRSGLTLISSTDVASSSVSPQEARAFIAQQEDTSAAAAPAAEVVDLADDDLEDME